MSGLITSANIDGVDDIYERLIELHEGRTERDSMQVNARLILILLNHVGDREAIFEAFKLAAESGSRG